MTDQTLMMGSLVRLVNEDHLAEGLRAELAHAHQFATVEPSKNVEALLEDKISQELLVPILPGQFLELTPIMSAVQKYLATNYLMFIMTGGLAIRQRAEELGWVGEPTSHVKSYADGYFRHYQNASIYWTPSFGPKEVHGAIRDRYFRMGAERSYLGFPQTDELSGRSSTGEEVRYSNFQGGTILWTATRGAFLIPSFSPITKRHQLGAWLYMVGSGFTPNSKVTFWIVNSPNPPAIIGHEYAAADGRIGANPNTQEVADLRNRPGTHESSVARAVDEATGHFADYRLPYALY